MSTSNSFIYSMYMCIKSLNFRKNRNTLIENNFVKATNKKQNF